MGSIKRKSLFSILVLFTLSLFIYSCTKPVEPEMPSEQKIEFSTQAIEHQTNIILTETFQTASEFLTDHSILTSENVVLNKTNGGKKYHFDGSYHVWEGTLESQSFPNAYDGEFTVKLQYQDENGNPQKSPNGAVQLYTYGLIWGQFGFASPAPNYGDKTVYQLTGLWTDLFSTPVFNANGKYERKWVGIYNHEDVTFDNVFKIRVKNLKFYKMGQTYSLVGRITITMDNYRAIVKCNGSNRAKVIVYENGEVMNTFYYNIPQNLYRWSFGGLILP